VKKKYFSTSKDKKDWIAFTKQMDGIVDKESNFLKKNINKDSIKKLDLHGFSLKEANNLVKKFVIDAFNTGYKKLLIITGKGLRSESHKDPYISEKLSVLKYSIPEYIQRSQELASKILKIEEADKRDGGEGAIYIYLKKKLQNKL